MADVPDSGDQPPAAAGEDGPGLTQRASDADRDRAVTQLRDHVVEGRLTLDEFSERVGRTLEARTQGDLVAVMRDLPVPAPSAPVAAEAPTATPVSARKKRRWHVAILSGHKTRGRWRISGQTNAVAVLGGCDMDLRRAEIEGPEVVITAFAFLGGIDITVPEGFDVDLQGFSFLGGRDLKLRDVPRVPGSPLIVVRGFAFLGGIDVKSRPNRTKRQLARAAAAAGLADPDDDDEDQPSGLLIPPVMPAPPLPTTPTPPPPMPTPPMSTPAPMSTSTSTPSPATPTAPWQTPPSSATPPPAQATPAQPPSDLADVTSDVATDGTVTILFCDMVDYAGMTERLGDQGSRQLLHEQHRLVRDALARHGGREVKVQGDGFMVAFGGVARALRCAIEIQRSTRDFVPRPGSEPIAVHIGVHTGDAFAEDGDYLGHTVIVASRLADVAGPGEILVSSLSEQLVQGSGEFSFAAHRETHLKGMARAQVSATLAWT